MERIDPFFILIGVLLLALLFWISGLHGRWQRKRRTRLRLAARKEENPWRRRELLAQWSELGGVKETRRALMKRMVRDQGQKARVGGKRLSANPYGHGLWGKGRLWKQGWKAVDRNIRWIEARRP